MTRQLLPFLTAVVVTASLAGAAFAVTPMRDQKFIDAHIPAITGYADKAPAVTSPEDGLAMVRKLLAYRGQMLTELQGKDPLTTPDGIETQDALDAEVVNALDRLARAGIATDTTHVTPQEAQAFMNALGPIPDLGSTPVAFMVIDLAQLTSMAADSLGAEGTVPRRAAAQIALQFMATGADRYFSSREGEERISNSQSLEQSAMITRLRCPKDGGIYRINAKKNRVQKNGDVMTLYYLQCTVCADPLLLEFPYDLATKLNKMAAKQKLPTPPQPLHPTGVDP